MVISVHFLVGAAIGKLTGNSFIAAPLSFASHYALDMVPHWQPAAVKNYKEAGFRGADKRDLLMKAIEPLCGVVITGALIYFNREAMAPMLVGAVFNLIPDILPFLEWGFGLKSRPRFLQWFEATWHGQAKFTTGLALQFVVFAPITLYMLSPTFL